VVVESGCVRLAGILAVPTQAKAVVAFAHGSGSGRLSPRNQQVARTLQRAGIATMLVDLLEEAEAEDRERVFDIKLLAERLEAVGDWLTNQPELDGLLLGYFGASTGAAAALVAAARQPPLVRAVVSRGGRPDLAGGEALAQVRAPTLLIVGGDDELVVELNERATAQMRCVRKIAVIPGATHLFPEPGALEAVAALAAEWFTKYLAR
jgi:putative phosphoribosyl transferase